MKKYRILLFIVMFFVLLPVRINALTGNINVGCPSNKIKAGETLVCSVSGNSSEAINSVQASISLSNNLQIVESSFTITDFKINIPLSSTETSFSIGTITIKSLDNAENGSANIKFSSILFTDVNNNSASIQDAVYDITIDNDDKVPTGLSKISITGGSLLGIFDTNTKAYNVEIDSDSFGIEAVAMSADDQIKLIDGDTNQELSSNSIAFSPKAGNTSMNIEILVGSGDRLVEYSILVSKKKVNIEEKYLSSLSVGGKSISLVDGKYDYEVFLNDISSFNVKAVIKDSSKYLIENLNGNKETGVYEINTNNTSPVIIIKPKDSSSGLQGAVYSISVKKSDTPSNPSSNAGNNNDNKENISNPQTGDISIFVITLILVFSLIISLNMYRKNIAYYN